MDTTGLTARQRLELARLCVEYDDRAADPAALAALAVLIGYALAEGIRPEQFGRQDRIALAPAFTAATLAAAAAPAFGPAPEGFCGSDVLRAAGPFFARVGADG